MNPEDNPIAHHLAVVGADVEADELAHRGLIRLEVNTVAAAQRHLVLQERGAPQLVTQVYTIGASTSSWVVSPLWGRAASTNPIGRRPGTSSDWLTVNLAASIAETKEARLNRRCAGKESTPSTDEASLESAV